MKNLNPLLVLTSVLAFSCAIRSADQVVDRNKIPAVSPGVASTSSEIRDLTFNRVAGESGHKDLHIRGMLFTKRDNGGGSQIVPCSGCAVMLKGIKDTSVVVKLTTENDGYFNFHGESGIFTLTLNNVGHNSVVIEPIQFESGGVTSMVLINAVGDLAERFNITQNGRTYTWSKQ